MRPMRLRIHNLEYQLMTNKRKGQGGQRALISIQKDTLPVSTEQTVQ
jgi:hypothetical protein